MKIVALALAAGLAMALALGAQELVENRFDRIHLRNGNVIDGQIVDRTDTTITLKIVGGEMIIRSTAIDWIEKVKMKSLKDAPVVVEKPGKEPAPGSKGNPSEGKTDLTPKVLELVKKWRAAVPDARYEVVKEIFPLGPQAAIVLLKHFQTFTPQELQHLVEPVVSELKPANAGPLLVPSLSSPKPILRAAALSLLGILGDTSALPEIVELLKDANPGVRSAAVGALNKLNGKDAIESIVRLGMDSESTVRTLALNVAIELCAKNERQVMPLLAGVLDQSKGEARADVAMALGRTKKPEAVPLLIRILGDEAPVVRSMALHTLAVMGAKEASPDVVNRLEVETDLSVRVYLVTAVEKLHIRKAISTLIKWLADPEEGIRTSSLAALKAMTNQNLAAEPAPWQAWWDGAKGND